MLGVLQDEILLLDWKQRLERDIETTKAQSNIASIRSVSHPLLLSSSYPILFFGTFNKFHL